MKREVVFLTGGTGLLGSYLLKKLLFNNSQIERVIALCRAQNQSDAKQRIINALKPILPACQQKKWSQHLRVICGDVSQTKFGLTDQLYNNLSKEITSIYHSAALTTFTAPIEVIREVNVEGTRNILTFSRCCQEKGQFNQLHHISTVTVAGNRQGVFGEQDIEDAPEFNNTYEQSKFEAEELIRQYRKDGVSSIIYRPAIVTGDTVTGYTNNFKMFYTLLRILSWKTFNYLPAQENAKYSFCPVDYVAKAISRISLSIDKKSNGIYHIANPNETTLGYLIREASEYFGFDIPKFISLKEFIKIKHRESQLNLLKYYIPYFNYNLSFDATCAQNILDKTNFIWPKIDKKFFARIFEFCAKSGFIKRESSVNV